MSVGPGLSAPSELIVRARPGADVWVDRDGRLRGGQDADPLRSALRSAGAGLWPLLPEPPAHAAAEHGVQAMARSYRVFGAGPAGLEQLEHAAQELKLRLAGASAVEAAYLKPPATLPVLPPASVGAGERARPEPARRQGDYRGHQGFLGPAPGGIGAHAAWERPGGGGAGVRIIDVEGEWRFTHEDLRHNPGRLLGGVPPGDLQWRNHGTSVLGLLAGDHNGRGVDGICPDARAHGISFFGLRWGSGIAIRSAADLLRPGDILLVEMMRAGPRTPRPGEPGFTADGQLGYVAAEYWSDDYWAIRYAVNRGVIVVAAAGNGCQRLDDDVYARGWFVKDEEPANPFTRAAIDSGSILVGAGAPPPGTHGGDFGPDRARLKFSNWGSGLDAQGWGREVTTTGGLGSGADALHAGPLEDRWYTDRFSGTSSAAPIVAGALACVQGVLRAAGRRPLSPAQARAALRETGSPQPAAGRGAPERIGNRPDLAQLIPWALEHAGPADSTETTPRRRPMKVTITIEDDDGRGRGRDLFTSDGGDAEAPGDGIDAPYIKGPSLVLPHEDGTVTRLSIAQLVALAGNGGAAPETPES